MNKDVSPKSEDDIISERRTAHMSTDDASSAVAESGTATTMVETDGGVTMGATTTNQTELVTKKMVPSDLAKDPIDKPAKLLAELPDPNEPQSLETPEEDSSPTSDLLERVNVLLSRVGSRKSFKSLEEMDEMASSFFVIIFERLFGHALSGAIKPPHLKLKSQRINNLRLVIKELDKWILENMNAVMSGPGGVKALVDYNRIAHIDAEQICTKGQGMEDTSKLVDVFLEVIELVTLIDAEDNALAESTAAAATDMDKGDRDMGARTVPVLAVEHAVPMWDAKEPLHRRGIGIASASDMDVGDDEVEHYMSSTPFIPDYPSNDSPSERSVSERSQDLTTADLTSLANAVHTPPANRSGVNDSQRTVLNANRSGVNDSQRTVLNQRRLHQRSGSSSSDDQDTEEPELQRSATYAGVMEALHQNPGLMKALMQKPRGSNLSSIALRLRREQDEWFEKRKANHVLALDRLHRQQALVRSQAVDRHKREVAAKQREERMNAIHMKQFLEDLERKRVSRHLKRKSQKDFLLKTALRRMLAVQKSRALTERKERRRVVEQNRRQMAAQREQVDKLYSKQLSIVKDELERERQALLREDKANKELHRKAMAHQKRERDAQLQSMYTQLDALDHIADWDEECKRVQRQVQQVLTRKVGVPRRPSKGESASRRAKTLRRKRKELRSRRLLKAYGPKKKKPPARMRVKVAF